MKCDESIDIMLDIIYGEEVDPSKAYEFFNHLKSCSRCDQEFRELTETRGMIREWSSDEIVPDSGGISGEFHSRPRVNWWGAVQKIAATVLIFIGGLAAGQAVGLVPKGQVDLPEAQLTRLINDIVVERQSEGWMVIGQALISMKEDMDLREREQTDVFYEDLTDMEERFLRVMEEARLNSREMTSQ